MISLGKIISGDNSKPSGGQWKKNVSQQQTKPTSTGKETEDDSSFQKALQKITNEFVDLKKISYGNPSAKKKFKPYCNNHNKAQPQQLTLLLPPTQGLNFEYGKMENYCCAHKKKSFLKNMPSFCQFVWFSNTTKYQRGEATDHHGDRRRYRRWRLRRRGIRTWYATSQSKCHVGCYGRIIPCFLQWLQPKEKGMNKLISSVEKH